MTTLQKNYDYSNVLWEEIYQRIKTIIRDEYNVSPYISPELNTKINSPFRIWSDLEGTESLFVGGWHKMYTISINQYFKKEDSERFYQRLYQDSERLYQLFFNNQGTQEAELLGFFDGKPQEVSISEEDEYFRVEVIFTCNVFRHDDAIYVETSPSAIRAAIRAIEPSYNFWSLGFDGTDDQINVGSGSSIDNIFDGGGTISMWINPIQQSNTMGIIQKRHVGGWQFLLSDNGGGISWRAKFVQEFDGGSHYQIQGKTRFFSVGNWYNIVISYNNSSISNTATIYVNGQVLPINTDSTPLGTRQDDSSGNMVIGDTGQYEFSGAMSDVALFNTALSSSTIETMYNNGTPILLTRNQGSYNSSGNLVAYYRMGSGDSDDKSTNGLIADQVNSGVGSNELSDYSMATDTWTESHFTYDATNDGYRFDDDTTGYIATTATGGSDTISLSSGTYKIQFTLLDGGTANGNCSLLFRVREPDNTTHTLISQTTYLSSPNGTTYTRYFYIPETSDVLEIYAYHPQSHDFLIKDVLLFKVGGNGGILNNFDGLDFKTNVPQIYDKALFSNSLAFDGTNDGINSGLEGLSAGSSFSFSAWINGSDFSSTDKTIISNGQLTNHRLFSIEGGKLFLQIFNGGYTGDNVTKAKASTTFSTGVWYNVIATFDGSNIKLYINGVEETTTEDGSGSTGNQKNNTTIGYLLRSTKESFFNGNIADVAVYSAVLDQTNVTAIYNSGKPIDLTCDAGNYNNANNLVGYWKMGDGYLDELPSALNEGGIFDQVTPIMEDEELVTNGDFSQDFGTGFSIYTGAFTGDGESATIRNGQAILKGFQHADYILQNSLIPANDNGFYRLEIDVESIDGEFKHSMNGSAQPLRTGITTPGKHVVFFQWTESFAASLRIEMGTYSGTDTINTLILNSVSLKKVLGNFGVCKNMNASAQSISVPE